MAVSGRDKKAGKTQKKSLRTRSTAVAISEKERGQSDAPNVSDRISPESLAQAVRDIRSGYSTGRIDTIKKVLNLDSETVARISGINIRTIARRRKEGSLRPDESDRVYRISRVLDLAQSVFGEKPEPLQNWFKTPKPALNGETPVNLLDTDPGLHQVRRLLNQIAYGIYT